jgi:hypothetical protein
LSWHPLSTDIKVKIYIIITSAFVVYTSQKYSLILREEYRLSMLENSVPRRIFGPNRE